VLTIAIRDNARVRIIAAPDAARRSVPYPVAALDRDYPAVFQGLSKVLGLRRVRLGWGQPGAGRPPPGRMSESARTLPPKASCARF
jgi:hypothetical protein